MHPRFVKLCVLEALLLHPTTKAYPARQIRQEGRWLLRTVAMDCFEVALYPSNRNMVSASTCEGSAVREVSLGVASRIGLRSYFPEPGMAWTSVLLHFQDLDSRRLLWGEVASSRKMLFDRIELFQRHESLCLGNLCFLASQIRSIGCQGVCLMASLLIVCQCFVKCEFACKQLFGIWFCRINQCNWHVYCFGSKTTPNISITPIMRWWDPLQFLSSWWSRSIRTLIDSELENVAIASWLFSVTLFSRQSSSTHDFPSCEPSNAQHRRWLLL
jgi:hypothetical protein